MTAPRTYWHLVDQARKPNDYDITSTKLLYYPERGFEVNVPLAAWYETYQRGSPLACADWDAFRDPRETTYTKYVELQRDHEIYVDGVLAWIDDTGYDETLSEAWLESLARIVPPLRYPVHGLQMVAAYVASMAPSGRIAIAAQLQCADEIRRVQRLAYRMRQLQQTHPGFGGEARAVWERDPAWQPMRELIERLLVAYDWGEALVALAYVVKPMFDDCFGPRLAALAQRRGDEAMAKLALALHADALWHAEWTQALYEMLATGHAGNAAVIDGWRARWAPRAAAAAAGLEVLFEDRPGTD